MCHLIWSENAFSKNAFSKNAFSKNASWTVAGGIAPLRRGPLQDAIAQLRPALPGVARRVVVELHEAHLPCCQFLSTISKQMPTFQHLSTY